MIEKTYRITTLGCRVNQADSIGIQRELHSIGFRPATGEETPGIWVVNTCAVTREGMRKSRKTTRKIARTGTRVLVTGCGVEMDPVVFTGMGENVVPFNSREKSVSELIEDAGTPSIRHEWTLEGLVRVPLKVQDGCDRFCAYCIVPYLRGEPRSRPVGEVLSEARVLVEAGAREITLCGINLGTYEDRIEGVRLPELILSVRNELPGIWIRLSSIEITDISHELIDLARSGVICKHFHIPLQSGDDGVLQDMGREYRLEDFTNRLEEIRNTVHDVAISTDVMVGFPTETRSKFEKTAEVLSELDFMRVHIFKYSPRPGTRAQSLGDPVGNEEKEERARILRKIAMKSASRFFRRFPGSRMSVLIEGAVREIPGTVFGRTDNYAGVFLDGDAGLVGAMVTAQITSSDYTGLRGNIIRIEEEGETNWKSAFSAE